MLDVLILLTVGAVIGGIGVCLFLSCAREDRK